uniref:Uncharacterized protein n=1 Tax=Chelonoidis abingdonii TaxID=106734 RepID=A0A8C0QQK9_CHEAB
MPPLKQPGRLLLSKLITARSKGVEPPLCCGRLIFTVSLSCLVLQLFLDDAKVKNFITCFKGNAIPSAHTGPLPHTP